MPTSTRRRALSDGDHVDTNSPPLTRARAAAAATAGTPPAPREELPAMYSGSSLLIHVQY